MDLQILPLEQPKPRPGDDASLAFGRQFTDRMFVMDYLTGRGWYNARIQPYQAFVMDPAAMVFHYAQEIFEGLKAFRRPDGQVALFRPMDNMRRFNHGAERMCMPRIDEEFLLHAIKELVRLEADWVPRNEGTSLYIRPTMIATEPMLGVRPADQYLCYVILCPVGAYYKGGLAPVKIWVSDHYVRAAHGGTGEVKTGGNYAASLYAARQAAEKGYDQVLWLDAREKKYVEEVGSMNMCFVINGRLITSPLHGTILDGITRRSVLTLAREMGIEVEERALTVEEIFEGVESGRLTEAFGTGTAVVISPVGQFTYRDRTVTIDDGKTTGELTQKLYDVLTGIQYGRLADPHGWVELL